MDPNLSRTDWLNEADTTIPAWQLDHDQATAESVRKLVESLIVIGPAVSRTELETAIQKLREEYVWNDDLAFAISTVIDEAEYHHGQWMAEKFSHEAMADDLASCLEDL